MDAVVDFSQSETDVGVADFAAPVGAAVLLQLVLPIQSRGLELVDDVQQPPK